MKFTLTIILVLLRVAVFSQALNPGADAVFRTEEVATIRLTLSPEDKAFLLDPDNVESEVYLPAVFAMENSQMDTVLEIPVGIRIRGNTSRYHVKKGFKIDFREFDGEKFYGYKKFNLKPNVNDPSVIREPLTLQFYREMNIPAARTHPVKVFMNDEYMGIYMNIEQLDDEFLELRFGHDGGYLYKCGYGANLADPNQVYNTVLFESEINKSTDTREQINHFVKILTQTSDANFVTEIEKVFNVERYLKQLAVEALLGHWDGYSYNQNNYYLYFNSETNLVEFLPYDADNTWGIDWVGRDWAIRDLNAWYKGDEQRPLTKRILDVPAYKNQYIANLRTLLKNYFNETYLTPLLDTYQEILSEAVEADTYYPIAFGFSHTTYLTSYTSGIANSHVDYGILEYLHTRTERAIEQIPEIITATQPETHFISAVYPNPSGAPGFYYTSTGTPPIILNSAGMRIEGIPFTSADGTYVELPASLPRGLYFIKFNNTVVKWLYR